MKGICFLCGNYETLEEHHIFGGARRPISTKYGLTVHLCPWCHRIDADSAHRSGKTAELLHQYGKHIIGRMGVPYHQRGVNVISVAMDAPADVISALSGKIGRLPGITAKTVYAPEDALK